MFCAVTSGRCRVSLPGYESGLEAGDFLLPAAAPAWVLAGGGPAPAVDFRPDHHATGERVAGPGDRSPELRLLGGFFAFAFDCGYQSYSAFSTAFRRVVGCSPAKWTAEG